MTGYVAKDDDGKIYLHAECPEYLKQYNGWFSTPDMIDVTDKFPEFDNIKNTDNPIKVEIKLEKYESI